MMILPKVHCEATKIEYELEDEMFLMYSCGHSNHLRGKLFSPFLSTFDVARVRPTRSLLHVEDDIVWL